MKKILVLILGGLLLTSQAKAETALVKLPDELVLINTQIVICRTEKHIQVLKKLWDKDKNKANRYFLENPCEVTAIHMVAWVLEKKEDVAHIVLLPPAPTRLSTVSWWLSKITFVSINEVYTSWSKLMKKRLKDKKEIKI